LRRWDAYGGGRAGNSEARSGRQEKEKKFFREGELESRKLSFGERAGVEEQGRLC